MNYLDSTITGLSQDFCDNRSIDIRRLVAHRLYMCKIGLAIAILLFITSTVMLW